MNGKLRARSPRLLPDAGSEAMQQAALAEARAQGVIAGKQVVKVVVGPKNLINIAGQEAHESVKAEASAWPTPRQHRG